MGAGDVGTIGEDLLGANISTLSTNFPVEKEIHSCE